MADSTPIEKLKNLQGVNIQNAGAILLAAMLTPVVTFFERSAAFIAAIINFPITLVQKLAEGLGMFIISLLAGMAGVMEASLGAAAIGFSPGNVWATLGPLAPTIGLASLLGMTGLAAYYFSFPLTADSIVGLLSATDIPGPFGANEDER